MAKWMVTTKKADFEGIARQLHVDPVLVRLLRNRDLTTPEEMDVFLHGGMDRIRDPRLMKDMEKAAGLLKTALSEEKHIRIIGDYDIDGVTSTYILKAGLTSYARDTLGKSLEAIHIDARIPDRVAEGYGMNDGMIQSAKEDGVDLILTCDNGISATPQVELAGRLGIPVIVTDHHEVPYTEENGQRREIVPNALAVVDPKQSDCNYPFPGICGGMVAWKLIQTLTGRMCEEYLPIAAFATIGDVMELKDENRIVVREGLKAFATTDNVGLKALMSACQTDKEHVKCYTVGFVLGPCINATGRLDTAYRALELFEEYDPIHAGTIASELIEMNQFRKNMTAKGVAAAEEILKSRSELPKVIAVFLPGFHESIAGIIAGRLREKYNRPVYVMTESIDGIKGSGRSIPAYHMYEHLHACEEFLTKYGGHAQAAGFSLKKEDLDGFIRALEERNNLTDEDLEELVQIDMPMPLSYVTEELIEQIELLEPFGNGNPTPVFADRNIRFISEKRLGREQNVARFEVADEAGRRYQAMLFSHVDEFDAYVEEQAGAEALRQLKEGCGNVLLKIVYRPQINEFRGRRSIQFEIRNYKV